MRLPCIDSWKPWISGHTSHLMMRMNTFENQMIKFWCEKWTETGGNNKYKKQPTGNWVATKKDIIQSRCFSKIWKYNACTGKSPSITGIMNQKNLVTSNTIDNCAQFGSFFSIFSIYWMFPTIQWTLKVNPWTHC